MDYFIKNFIELIVPEGYQKKFAFVVEIFDFLNLQLTALSRFLMSINYSIDFYRDSIFISSIKIWICIFMISVFLSAKCSFDVFQQKEFFLSSYNCIKNIIEYSIMQLKTAKEYIRTNSPNLIENITDTSRLFQKYKSSPRQE
jgi:hypothetical protein